MIVYFAPIFVIGLGYLYKSLNNGCALLVRHKYDFFMILAALIMLATIGFRGNGVGSDTPTYEFIYRWYGTMSIDEMILRGPNNILFLGGCAILYRIGIPFLIYLSILFGFTIYTVIAFLNRYVKDYYLGFLIYIFLDFYILNFSMVRQSVALAFCLLYFVIRKNDKIDFFRFILCYVCAVGFHTVALIFFPAYFISKWKYKKSIAWIFVLLCLVTYLAKDVLLHVIFGVASWIEPRYLKFYEMTAGGHAGIKLYILICGMMVATLLFCTKESKEKNSSWIYMLLICMLIFPFLMSGGVILRAMYYYMIFIIAFIPQALDGIQSYVVRSWGKLLVILGGFLYFWLEVSNNTLSILPYRTFWQ